MTIDLFIEGYPWPIYSHFTLRAWIVLDYRCYFNLLSQDNIDLYNMSEFVEYFNKKQNGVAVLSMLIASLKSPVSLFTIKNKLLSHPYYPSLLSLSDSLTSWNIPNQSFKIDKQSFVLEELPYPFVAHQQIAGGQFVIVHAVDDNYVICSDENIKRQPIHKHVFLENWDGIILYAESGLNSGEAGYRQAVIHGYLNALRLPFLIATAVGCIFYSINYTALNWSYSTVLLLHLTGLIVSILLTIQSVDANNSLLQKLCSLGKKNNCNAILQSDASKITSWLSWSEVGLFYFTGYFICLLIFPSSLGILSWLSLACLPYTLYSIGYQLKMKNWCLLCCSVQLLLWLAVVLLYKNSSFVGIKNHITARNLTCYSLCFLFPIAIWAYVKPFFLKANLTESLTSQLKKFKFNSQLFNLFISSQTHYSVPDDLKPIVIGSNNAQTVITMVSNPFCNPCARAHKVLERLIEERDDIRVQIIFSTALHENRTQVAQHLNNLSQLEDKEVVTRALNEWYDQTDRKYDEWAKKYPVFVNQQIDKSAVKQNEWCEMNDIHSTPTIMIDGYKLTSPYKLDDIVYLLN